MKIDDLIKNRKILFEICLLTSFFILAMVLRQRIAIRLFPDSIEYLQIGRNILEGVHHTGGITLAKFRRPPLYPHLIALFASGKVDPLHLAEVGRQISVFAGTFLILPVYLMARRMFGVTAAIACGIFVVLTPEFMYYSSSVLSESLATLVLMTGMLFLWKIGEDDPPPVYTALTGIMLGLTFLTRHALIGYLPLTLAWIILIQFIRRKQPGSMYMVKVTGKTLAIVLIAFFLTISPQVLYLHSQTGQWSLAVDPTTSPVQNMKKQGRDIRFTATGEQAMSLTPDAEHYIWEKGGLPGLAEVIFERPGEYFKTYFSTILRGYLPDTYPLPYPKILLIMTTVGIILALKERKYAELLFCAWGFGGYYLFITLFLNVRDRYMFPAYPFLILIAGAGVSILSVIITSRFNKENRLLLSQPFVASLLCLILAVSLLPGTLDLSRKFFKRDDPGFFVHLGSDLGKRIRPGSWIIDRNPHLPFFSGGTMVRVPYAEIEEVIHFARSRGIDYWVVSTMYVPNLRPQFTPLLNPSITHAGLHPVVMYGQENGPKIIVYEILRK